MAAPANKTNKDLSGTWALNKSLSDSTEPALTIQGIGFFSRKAVKLASIVIAINQYEGPANPPSTDTTNLYTHVDIVQTVSGLSSSEEKRCLDNEWREHSDTLFGEVRGQTRWVTLADIDDAYLTKNWEESDKFLRSYAESPQNGWVAVQIWGFQVIDGVRRHCRNIVVTKGEERAEMRLVYDFQS